MKFLKCLILGIFCSFSIIYGQNYRFTYNYRSIPDTLNKNNIINEDMILEVRDNKSVFLSQKKIISDSVMIADAKKGIMTMPDPSIQTKYIVTKEYSDVKTRLITEEFSTSYKFVIVDERPLNWKILPEKKMIGEYQCQKAVLDFAGRQWTAWFTEEIPFSDGPYKFRGLPGLIVQIGDSKEYHVFQLKGVQKNNNNPYESKVDKGTNTKNLSFSDFVKFYKEYRKDPVKEFKQNAVSGKIYYESEEKRIEHMMLVEKLNKERIKKDNNIIELDLLKK
ncbi:GLPGLI family protein [Chryseobacterium sp. SIMBA_029]|uniref:GLPGLI family protein n=1 Tax=Chryseobacterium sp. SIMBA_029 TaxID=3085772 RepID=UPI00397D49E5